MVDGVGWVGGCHRTHGITRTWTWTVTDRPPLLNPKPHLHNKQGGDPGDDHLPVRAAVVRGQDGVARPRRVGHQPPPPHAAGTYRGKGGVGLEGGVWVGRKMWGGGVRRWTHARSHAQYTPTDRPDQTHQHTNPPTRTVDGFTHRPINHNPILPHLPPTRST